MSRARFYRAVSKPARFGGPGTFAKHFAFTFQAENAQLARDHAKHCFSGDSRGLELEYVQFMGFNEPAGMGELEATS